MTDRHTVDTINSDQLDELYDDLARARQELADRAAADSADAAAGSYAGRAEGAEATLRRIADLADRWASRTDQLRVAADHIRTTLAYGNHAIAEPSCSPGVEETEPNNPAATEATDLQTRVTALFEQWAKAGPPPLGTPMSRWWDRRLVELHAAIRPADESERTTPDNPPTSSNTPDNPLEERIRTLIESEMYEYRERTMFWPEGGVTEEIARLATRGAMEVLDGQATPAWTPPPPGSTAEQLPEALLALIRDHLPDYTSTACQTADTLACAACYPGSGIPRPQYDEIREQAEHLHSRCRLNNKFTGQLCACGCHPEEQP